jgi:hypothetical protein
MAIVDGDLVGFGEEGREEQRKREREEASRKRGKTKSSLERRREEELSRQLRQRDRYTVMLQTNG